MGCSGDGVEVGADFFEGGGSDAVDALEVVDGLKGAGLDDAVGGDAPDAGDGHELVPVGLVKIQWLVGRGISDGEGGLGFFAALGEAFIGEGLPVGETPGALSASGGGQFGVFQLFDVVVAGGAPWGAAVNAIGPGHALLDEEVGEVLSVGGCDEGINSGVAGGAASIGKCGMNGKGFGEQLKDSTGCEFGLGFGQGNGGRGGATVIGDPEVASLGSKPPGIGRIADVPFNRIGSIEPDGDELPIGEPDLKAVRIRPFGLDKRAAAKGLELRSEESGREEEQGSEEEAKESGMHWGRLGGGKVGRWKGFKVVRGEL